jgi:CDP-diacylglycerol--glycerol-3-phosphate 3-phosphatidyltransferase
MNNIEILKEIGLAEISRKTHIDATYISYIINQDYKNLMRFNTRGFIKILQREYDIDFSQWLDGYNLFLSEHSNDNANDRVTVEPSISAYKSTPKNSYGFLYTILILVLLAVIVWFLELHKYLDELPKFFIDGNQSVSYSNTTTVQAAQQNLIELKEENMSILLPPEENISTNLQDIPALEVNDKNLSQSLTLPIEPTLEQNTTKSLEFDTSNTKEFSIIPNRKVWIGIIDLDTDKKYSQNTANAVKIDTNKNQLLVTGHGEITLQIDNFSKKFNSDNPIRFLVQNNKIKMITLEEFSTLNKGKSW